MRKIFITLLSGIFLCLNFVNAQLTISMSSSQVDPGANATVDVTVSGFTALAGTEYSINYDSTVLEFVSFTNVTPLLVGLGNGLSGPIGSTLKKGQLVVSWFDGSQGGVTIPNGTRIFSIVFKAIGAAGTKSDVFTSNVPRKIEISDSNLNPVTLINNKGTVTIKGTPPSTGCTSPTCANASNLTLVGAQKDALKGTEVCIAITVKNFIDIVSGQGSISWDSTLLKYKRYVIPTTNNVPGMSSNSFNDLKASSGKFGFLWSSLTTNPVTVPDNTVFFELCFDVIGKVGDVACIKLNETSPVSIDWSGNTAINDLCYTFGKVTIIDVPMPSTVAIKTGTGSGKVGDIVCVDVSVDSFSNIFGVGTTFSWNPAQLKFIRTEGYSLEGLNSSMFNSNGTTGTLKLLWSNGTAITKPNGHVIFKICFELLCPDASNYTATISVPGPTDITGTVNGSPATVAGTTSAGSIAITCGTPPEPKCTTGTITHVTCNGGTDGSAAMTVTDATADCVFQWKLGTTIVKTGLVSAGNLNLTGAAAGTYTFEVLCSGVPKTSCTATINQPTAIVIPTSGVITNVGCASKGAINITTTSGGNNGGYTFNWNPAQGNTANPTNLNAGVYLVTVTDSRNCTATASFTVGTTESQLSTVTITGTNVKCKNGTDGAALVNVSGGCTPYTYAWTGGLTGSNPQGVKAGTYTVTVSDSASPAKTGTATITITEPNALDISLTGTTGASTSTAADGGIKITITGGTPNYKTIWSGGIPDANTSGVLDVNNVKAGTYNVTVTDANGCTAVRTGILVDVKPPTTVAVELGTATVTSGDNGFGVLCFDDRTGVISGKITKGSYPMTITLKSGNPVIQTVQIASGTDYTFTGLAAGSYTVTASNAAGASTSSVSVVITQPTKLVGTPNINCSTKNQETGSVEINMNGTGAGNYSFVWSGLGDLDNKIENLASGFYNVTVTDDNGCQVKLTNLEVKSCTLSGTCYEASTVITPNGDNLNDLFIINCVTDNAADLTVFDRWGRLVYSQPNYDNTWQGTDNDNKDLKEGGYIWVLNINFGQGRREVYKGTLTILTDK